jgi:hypothetical protein
MNIKIGEMQEEEEDRRLFYASILAKRATSEDRCQPFVLSESDPHLAVWAGTQGHLEEWMEIAKLIAVGGHRLVLEDGPDVCDLESPGEHSDHGDELTGLEGQEPGHRFGGEASRDLSR